MHVWGKRQMHTLFPWGNLKERGRSEDDGVNDRIILK
jgi:hypothetical protein